MCCNHSTAKVSEVGSLTFLLPLNSSRSTLESGGQEGVCRHQAPRQAREQAGSQHNSVICCFSARSFPFFVLSRGTWGCHFGHVSSARPLSSMRVHLNRSSAFVIVIIITHHHHRCYHHHHHRRRRRAPLHPGPLDPATNGLQQSSILRLVGEESTVSGVVQKCQASTSGEAIVSRAGLHRFNNPRPGKLPSVSV